MTKNEFQKRVIALLKKYHPNTKMKEKIIPLFAIVDNLTQEEMGDVYKMLEEAIVTQKESDNLTVKLNTVFAEFNNTIQDVSKRLSDIQKKLHNRNKPASGLRSAKELYNIKRGPAMKFNKHSFQSEKPNFGLKLNKLFSSFITEYGPDNVTIVVSDSIIYANNLILRLSLKNQDVMISSAKSIKFYKTPENENFLISDRPEIIPCGNKKYFYFKYITYEEILHLTNGDFFKVFHKDILQFYKKHEVGLPARLKRVGYFKFE
jgi:DNA-binding ferritin-like protein (Dps family)